MATIEPRLIHLLNESTSTPHHSHPDLPPLHALPLHAHGDRPLPRLDRDVNRHAASHPYPIRLLLDDSDSGESRQGHGAYRDDSPEGPDDVYHKKRSRATMHVKDDFVQLPQPLKKQKATQQALVMPPIINGLHEPPPHAALFPPISSTNYDNDASQMKLMHDFNNHSSPDERSHRRGSSETDKSSSKGRKRAAKPRRKWTDEETNHLLLGVNRHGVGKWTNILEDPDFAFNERTAGDLKDRFRTCCPEELRGATKGSRFERRVEGNSKSSSRKGLHSENILISEEKSRTKSSKSPIDPESPKHKKSRAHRKNMEDLAELGIHGPFKKSHRRERRPFTEQDDHEILEGLDHYGPAWTKIQRDPRYHLSTRQPTDLRDRVRNKYPAIYQRIEKGTFQSKDSSRGNDIMEPSVNMSIDNSLKRSKVAAMPSRRGSRDEAARWPAHLTEPEYAQPSNFEFGEVGASHFMGGEMDISRLLLDDPRMAHSQGRQGELSGPSSPTAAGVDPRRDRYEYALRC
ncbi:MYB DNA-binding domain containing protein [Cordyceps militaris CM01]|uniref:MYB DNA-binding domain containing protein n=1 Tax=Cordyceps militaris (strain CM01) TaxID=983644 RepID=G3J9R4_CORMM|nr:MYB DNA-binding domain containing protein [Cordyceps militaris CM01]EGX94987.1 MYB DNA-binding domain containing protein [Cordyceps militaris CM01]